MAFDGIPTAALDFYEDLEADNSKAFWQARKDSYEQSVKAPILALAEELSGEFGTPKFFRPYRDVRFSKDKTPYKTHQGVWFGESSTYLQVSAAGLLLAAGYWHTSPTQVDRLRRAVADDIAGPALERAITAVRRTKFEIAGETITRVPAGYDKEHPRAELLRHKTLTAHRDLGCPGWLSTKRAKTEIAKAWRGIAPLTDWLDTHVGAD